MIPDDEAGRLSVRFVDAHSGRNDLLGRVAVLEAMARVVARRLEGARPGSRFPLLQLVGREAPLTADECDSLVREIARLRHLLAALPARAPTDGVAAETPSRDAVLPHPLDGVAPAAASAKVASPEVGPPHRAEATQPVPRSGTLADAYAWPLFVLEHIARLGAASRRGARFEIGEASSFAATRTPLKSNVARV